MNTSPAPNARQAAAVALVEQHLADIKAHKIMRRYVNNRVVWLVNGHIVTLDPVTCDCGDFQHRHPEGGCKHVQAVRLLQGQQAQPAAPAIRWTADERRARRRTETVEEL